MCITVITGEFTQEKFFPNVFYFVIFKNVFKTFVLKQARISTQNAGL